MGLAIGIFIVIAGLSVWYYYKRKGSDKGTPGAGGVVLDNKNEDKDQRSNKLNS